MTTWKEDRTSDFLAMVLEFGGGLLEYKGHTCSCIHTPIQIGFEMTGHGYKREADTQIDILRTDAAALGLSALRNANPSTKRPNVTLTIEGVQQLLSVIEYADDDPAEPTVQLKCKQLQ